MKKLMTCMLVLMVSVIFLSPRPGAAKTFKLNLQCV